jgi:hypothetical protein
MRLEMMKASRLEYQRGLLARYRETLGPRENDMYKVALHRIETGDSLVVFECSTLSMAKYAQRSWEHAAKHMGEFAVYILPVDANA